MLKPEIIQTVVPTIIGEIKTELISELKSVIKSAIIQAIEDATKPLQHYGISVMSVAHTVLTPRFDCVVYLLHVLDRRFLGES
jgi:hypothetical protein